MDIEFTAEMRKVVAMAREEALRQRNGYVGPEHLLLGLLRAGDPEVSAVLAWNGIEETALRDAVLEQVRPGQSPVVGGTLAYTSLAKRSLELAGEIAGRRASEGAGPPGEARPVDGVALLAGLLAERRGLAAQVLRDAGFTADARWSEAREGDGGPDITIDDASDRSIYEQIVIRIKEQIAVGTLRPGTRLPPVRRLADQLDIAPGTVARAYGELERLGLVVTGGARGTRVAEPERSTVPDEERAETLIGLLRPVVVAAFHLGGTAEELRTALDRAMADIFHGEGEAGA